MNVPRSWETRMYGKADDSLVVDTYELADIQRLAVDETPVRLSDYGLSSPNRLEPIPNTRGSRTFWLVLVNGVLVFVLLAVYFLMRGRGRRRNAS